MTRRSERSYEEMDRLDWAIHFLRMRARRLWGNLLTWRERRAWDRNAAPLRADAVSLIPANSRYCHGSPLCPFWHRTENLPEQQSGYCSLLRVGDWQDDGAFLLWDQVKECGINHRGQDKSEGTP